MRVIVEGTEKVYRQTNVSIDPIKTIRAIKGKYCHVPVNTYIDSTGKAVSKKYNSTEDSDAIVTYYDNLSENQMKIIKLTYELESALRIENDLNKKLNTDFDEDIPSNAEQSDEA